MLETNVYAPLFSATADETELNTVVHETIDRNETTFDTSRK